MFLQWKYWSQSILSKLESLVGIPLFMDKATTQFERLADDHCFVEISSKFHLQKHVYLEIKGRDKVRIDVEYEWIPLTCF